jgi:hypothetical protein
MPDNITSRVPNVQNRDGTRALRNKFNGLERREPFEASRRLPLIK